MTPSLAERLAVFIDGGLVTELPNRWQILQGELEMWPWVLSDDVTDEVRYAGAPLGHPILRQPLIFATVGLDHLAVGTGLSSALGSVCTHLHFTHHQGMPVWDLQLVQTHPGGLHELQRATEALISGNTRSDRSRLARLRWILPEPETYLERFLGSDGWIARADRLDYDDPVELGLGMPPQFFSLSAFMRHCATAHPEHTPVSALPRRMLELATARFRMGKGFGSWVRRTGARS